MFSLSAKTQSATTTYTYDHTTERTTKITNGITTIYPHDSWNKGGSTTTIHITDPYGVELATIEGSCTIHPTKEFAETHEEDFDGGTTE